MREQVGGRRLAVWAAVRAGFGSCDPSRVPVMNVTDEGAFQRQAASSSGDLLSEATVGDVQAMAVALEHQSQSI